MEGVRSGDRGEERRDEREEEEPKGGVVSGKRNGIIGRRRWMFENDSRQSLARERRRKMRRRN